MVVPPKSSILIGFSTINHPFWGTIIFWKHPYVSIRFHPQLDITCGAFSSALVMSSTVSAYRPDIPLSVSLFPVSWGVDPHRVKRRKKHRWHRWQRKEERNYIYIFIYIYVIKMFQSPSKRNLQASIVYIHVLIWNNPLCMKWLFSIGLFCLYNICQKRCHVARCFFLTKHHQTFLKTSMKWRRNNRCSDVGGHFQALDEIPLIRLNDMTLKSPWNNISKHVDLHVFLMKRRVTCSSLLYWNRHKKSHLAPFIRRRCGILSYLWMSTS